MGFGQPSRTGDSIEVRNLVGVSALFGTSSAGVVVFAGAAAARGVWVAWAMPVYMLEGTMKIDFAYMRKG